MEPGIVVHKAKPGDVKLLQQSLKCLLQSLKSAAMQDVLAEFVEGAVDVDNIPCIFKFVG